MCLVDDSDPPSVSRQALRKARKAYRCDECRREVKPGETYHYLWMVVAGDPSTARTCEHCWQGCAWLIDNCDGYPIGMVLDDLEAHASEYPALREPLAAFVAAMRGKWQAGGALMPVPAVPPPIIDPAHSHAS